MEYDIQRSTQNAGSNIGPLTVGELTSSVLPLMQADPSNDKRANEVARPSQVKAMSYDCE